MKPYLRLVGGFGALIIGALITLPLPEFGVPLLLVGSRLLGDRYKWAQRLNSRVDAGWVKVKAWVKRTFRR